VSRLSLSLVLYRCKCTCNGQLVRWSSFSLRRIGQHHLYNFSFFVTCMHVNTKRCSVCSVSVYVNLMEFSFSVSCHCFDARFSSTMQCLAVSPSLFLFLYARRIKCTHINNTSLQTIIFFSVLVIEGRNKFIFKPQIYTLN
jgi:hypothetical protein